MILGLMGYRGSGKSLAAAALENRLGFVQLDFVEPIRNMVCRTLGWDDERDQDEVCTRWGISQRQAVLEFGRVGRILHHEFWIDRVVDTANQHTQDGTHVVVPHVRTISEVRAIQRAGGVVWRMLVADVACVKEDPLEAGQDGLRVSKVIYGVTAADAARQVVDEARGLLC